MSRRWGSNTIILILAGMLIWWHCKNNDQQVVAPEEITGDLLLVLHRPDILGSAAQAEDSLHSLFRKQALIQSAQIRISASGMQEMSLQQSIADTGDVISCRVLAIPSGADRFVAVKLLDALGVLRYQSEAVIDIKPAIENRVDLALLSAGLNILAPKSGEKVSQRRTTLYGSAAGLQDSLITIAVNGFLQWIKPSREQFASDLILLQGHNRVSVSASGQNDQVDFEADIAPVDMLILLAWDRPADLDLHVIEPSGERCNARHLSTASGGRMLNTSMMGFGPECYNVPAGKGKDGVYQVEINYAQAQEAGEQPVNAYLYLLMREGQSSQIVQSMGPFALSEAYREDFLTPSHANAWKSAAQINWPSGTILPLGNHAPVWIQGPADSTLVYTAGADLSMIRLAAMDPDGDEMSMSIARGPDFLELFQESGGKGFILVHIDRATVGLYPDIQIIVQDNGTPQLTDTLRFNIEIIPGNRKPAIAPDRSFPITVHENANGGAGENVRFVITDENNDELEVAFLPDPQAKFIVLKPVPGDRPGYLVRDLILQPDYEVCNQVAPLREFVNNMLIVKEKRTLPPLSDTLRFAIKVQDVNRPPVFANPEHTIPVSVGQTIDLEIAVTDPDSDSITLASDNLIPDLELDPVNKKIIGKVSNTLPVGTKFSTVTASDGALTSTGTFRWLIGSVAPYIDCPDTLIFSEGSHVDTSFIAMDSEGGLIQFSFAGLPPGLTPERVNDNTFRVQGDLPNACEPQYSVTITATDLQGMSGQKTVIWWIENPKPAITPPAVIPPCNTGDLVDLLFSASDPDGDDLEFGVTSPLPDSLSIDANSGRITGRLAYTSFGTHTITVYVDDGEDRTEATILLVVSKTNRRPFFSVFPGDKIDAEGETILYADIKAIDPDGDRLVYSLSGQPSGININPSTAEISGFLDYSTERVYTVHVTVSDGKETNSVQFTWTVTHTNQPPVFVSPPTFLKNQEGETITNERIIRAADPDSGDVLTWSYSMTGPKPSIPDLQFDASQGRFYGVISMEATGLYKVTVIVKDQANAADTTKFEWQIKSFNQAPVFTVTVPDQDQAENEPAHIELTAMDPDGDVLQYRISGAPDGVSIDDKTGLIAGKISYEDVRVPVSGDVVHQVMAIVSDSQKEDTLRFQWRVRNTNRQPLITAVADRTTDEDVAIGPIPVNVDDPDGFYSELRLTAQSGDTTVVPNDRIGVNGSGTSWTLTINPAKDQNGTAPINLHVTDGDLSDDDDFLLTVSPVNDAPTMSAIGNQSTPINTAKSATFTVNDIDTPLDNLLLNGTSSNKILLPDWNITFSGTGGTRTITMTPAHDQIGETMVTVTLSDGAGGLVMQSFMLTVYPVSHNPVISDIANRTINEDANTGAIVFTVSDPDDDENQLVLSAASSNTGLVPVSNVVFGGSGGSRTVTVTPVANGYGTATITVTVRDPENNTDSDSFVLAVAPVNDTPTMLDIGNQSTPKNSVKSVDFAVNDIDTPLGNLTPAANSSNTTLLPNGNISFSGTGATRSITMTPAANKTGTTTVTVTVSDGDKTVQDSFVLTVDPNQPPEISDITNRTINEDANAGAIAFTVSDPDDDENQLTLSAASSNTGLVPVANVVFGGSGGNRTVTVTPVSNGNGTATITVTVKDPDNATDSDAFVLTVNAVNDAPTISNIVDQSTAMNSVKLVDFTVNDIDTPLNSLTPSATSSNTTLLPNVNISFSGTGGTRTITMTPAAEQTGTTTVTVTVSDGDKTVQDSFVLTVQANQPPVISDITNRSIDEDTNTGAIGFTVSDPDDNANQLTLSAASSNTGLVPVANIVFGGSGGSRTVTVTPVANGNGTATITVTVKDPDNATNSDSFVLTVTAVNDAPTMSNIYDQSTAKNSVKSVDFTVNDIDTPLGNLTPSATSSNTTLLPNGNISFSGTGGTRTITMTPAANKTGTTTITVTENDGAGGSVQDSFVLTVEANKPPVISDITDRTIDEDTNTGAIAITVNDPDDNENHLTLTAASSNTGLVPVANVVFGGAGGDRTVTVTPVSNGNGTATITVTVKDPDNATDSEVFVLTVTAVNDAPTMSDIGNQSISKNSVKSVDFTVNDIDTPLGSLTPSATSSNTVLLPNGNISFSGTGGTRTITMTPAANKTGTTTITVTVSDGDKTVQDSFVLTVQSNQPPEISDITNWTINEDANTGAIAFTVNDPDDDENQLLLSAASSNTVLVPVANVVFGGSGGNRTVTVTPVANGNGTATITVTVKDPDNATDSDSFLLTVVPVNDPPKMSSITDPSTLINSTERVESGR